MFDRDLALAGMASLPVATAEAAALQLRAAFDAALSAGDSARLEALWAQDETVTLVQPEARAPLLGWAAVRQGWRLWRGGFAELSLRMPAPRLYLMGQAALLAGLEQVRGRRLADDAPVAYQAMTTQGLEWRGGGWLLVSHHATIIAG